MVVVLTVEERRPALHGAPEVRYMPRTVNRDDLGSVARARRDFGDAIVAVAMIPLPVLVRLAMAPGSHENEVFWGMVVALGTSLTLGRTVFLYGGALGWPGWKCWLAALVCGGIQAAAWVLYFWLAPRAPKA